MIRSTLTILTITSALTCSLAFANISAQKPHHHICPLMNNALLATAMNQETGANEIAVINTILWQNHYGNIHVNKQPVRLSALESVTISPEWEAMLKPAPHIIERAPIYVMLQSGQTNRTLQNEFLTVIQDEPELHAQVTHTKNPDGCLTEKGCEADEMVLE